MVLCPLRAWFGIDCPLCGGLRMTGSLLHGDLSAAVHYNVVAFAFLLLFSALALSVAGYLIKLPLRKYQVRT